MNSKKQADHVWGQRKYSLLKLEMSQSNVSMSMLLSNVFSTSKILTAVAFQFHILVKILQSKYVEKHLRKRLNGLT